VHIVSLPQQNTQVLEGGLEDKTTEVLPDCNEDQEHHDRVRRVACEDPVDTSGHIMLKSLLQWGFFDCGGIVYLKQTYNDKFFDSISPSNGQEFEQPFQDYGLVSVQSWCKNLNIPQKPHH
jgi:hypothetical protein